MKCAGSLNGQLTAADFDFRACPETEESEQDIKARNQLTNYLAPGTKLPGGGVTLLYGKTKSRSLAGYLWETARKSGLDLRRRQPVIHIGPWLNKKLTIEDACKQRFMGIPDRILAPVMDDINRHWNRYLAEEGLPAEMFPRKPSTNMHLLDRLAQESPYDEITAFSYSTMTVAGLCQFITVYSEDAIQWGSFWPDADKHNRAVLDCA